MSIHCELMICKLNPMFDAFELYSFVTLNGVRHYYDGASLEPVAFTRGLPPPPLATIESETAQKLMDQLWDSGVRPVASQQSHGQFAAASRHLEDMRAIAFSKLNLDRPKGAAA